MKPYGWMKAIDKRWDRWAKKINKKTSLVNHFYYFSLFLSFGIFIFISLYLFVLPGKLPVEKTTAINWLILHQHSLILDYIRFALFVTVIPFSIVVGWLIMLWRRKI